MAKSGTRNNRAARRAATNTAKATASEPKFFSAGRYTVTTADGSVDGDFILRERMMALRAKSLKRQSEASQRIKTAGLFNDGSLGPANIADSDNIGYYSYEFPVDSLEMPQSRPEELRFYRLAYDRDPIVGRAIDLHTELPLSKMQLEKSKCSVEPFADYVFDYFQRLVNDTGFFSTIIEATREHHTIGETFLYVIQPQGFLDLEISDVLKKSLSRGRGYEAGISPMSEAENAPVVGQEREITEDWLQAKAHKRSSKIAAESPDPFAGTPIGRLHRMTNEDWIALSKRSSKLFLKAAAEGLFEKFAEEGIEYSDHDDLDDVQRLITKSKAKISKLVKLGALPKMAALKKTAEPGDTDAPPDGGAAPDAPAEDAAIDDAIDGMENAAGGADLEGGGDPAMDMGPVGGGGGFGGGGSVPEEHIDGEAHALATAEDAERAQKLNDLKRYLHLLERKKELLEELKDVTEKRQQQREIFSHVTNGEYEGFDRIQMLPPEKIELAPNAIGGAEPQIFYKPTEEELKGLLENQNLDQETREMLETDKKMPLNQDPFKGPYVIHFARKKAMYELHGRSILQRCMRTIIYREKLRQVQTTLASRNMTPKTVITAPGVSEVQVAELRAHADEAKADPDYTIVTNYDLTWNEISSQGRLLALGDEYAHLNSDLAIGMGFTPEILIGEGMYGGNRIALELLQTTYTQFRESLTNIIENKIFKPISMLKGFYEVDNYGRPRWIYPKVTFSRLALRDSGDVYEMLFNLYAKGSLPVSTVLDFLGIDPETVKRQLEDDLFTVNDSKFNELLSNVYGAVAQSIIDRTDIVNRLSQGMTLKEQDLNTDQIEGSGEGM